MNFQMQRKHYLSKEGMLNDLFKEREMFTPEKRLLASNLLQGIMSCRADDLAWVMSNDEPFLPMSYRWICEMLEVNPATPRKVLTKMLQNE